MRHTSQVAPKFPHEITLFSNLQLVRLFSDDIPATVCIAEGSREDCPLPPPEQVGQVYFNMTEVEDAMEDGLAR